MNARYSGIYCAIVTPFKDGQLDIPRFQMHVRRMIADGCDGVLVAGTTGEGPSLSIAERCQLVSAGREVSDSLKLLAGTGCSSLPETIQATRQAYELGADGVVIVPPFFFRNVSTQGLFEYYQTVFLEAVPASGGAFLYHIPQVSGVPISIELLDRLLAAVGTKLAGLKDSSGDRELLIQLCQQYPNLSIFAGLDDLLLDGLQAGAAGYITAEANLLAAPAAAIYKAFQLGQAAQSLQDLLVEARVFLPHTSFSAAVKALLAVRYNDPAWCEVRPPLEPLAAEDQALLIEELRRLQLFT